MAFNDNIPKEAVTFRSGVFEYENQMKEHSFEELASCFLVCLGTQCKDKAEERIAVKLLSITSHLHSFTFWGGR